MKVLIITNSPLPVSTDSTVEGGGIRSWTLHQGLLKNGIESSIATSAEIDPEINIFHFDSYLELSEIAQNFDAIIYNYAVGDLILRLIKNLPENILRIADLYVPIHIEVSARELPTHELKKENDGYKYSSIFWENTIKISDLFLMASESQLNYYLGLFAGIHFLEPQNYSNLKFFVIPQSPVENVPAKPINKDRRGLNILWWGGFYPWFDAQNLSDLAKQLYEFDENIKIKVVGGINPYVQHDFFQLHARSVIDKLDDLPNVELLPWINYGQRKEMFEEIDLVLMLNKSGWENGISFRTRLIDAIEFERPILTNGGDPFSEIILNHGGGFRVENTSDDLALSVTQRINREDIIKAGLNLRTIKFQLNSEVATRELASFLKKYDTKNFSREVTNSSVYLDFKLNSNLRIRLFSFLQREGLARTLSRVCLELKKSSDRKFYEFKFKFQKHISGKKKFASQDKKKVVILLHQLNRSGATLIGIDLAKFLKLDSTLEVVCVVPRIIDYQLANEIFGSEIDLEIVDPSLNISDLVKNSIVIINSAAVPKYWQKMCIQMHERDEILKLGFFIHEHMPEKFYDNRMARKLKLAFQKGGQFFVPSTATRKNLFAMHNQAIESSVVKNRVEKIYDNTDENDIDQIKICIVGPTNDSRKRQLDILIAIYIAQNRYVGDKFRKINVNFIGLGEDELGREIRRLADLLLLPGTFELNAVLPKEGVLKKLNECNVVVSLADDESFGLYIAEAMASGSVVLRTNSGGFEELLENGFNGFELDGTVEDLVNKLGLLANLETNNSHSMNRMMENSKLKVNEYIYTKYEEFVEFLK